MAYSLTPKMGLDKIGLLAAGLILSIFIFLIAAILTPVLTSGLFESEKLVLWNFIAIFLAVFGGGFYLMASNGMKFSPLIHLLVMGAGCWVNIGIRGFGQKGGFLFALLHPFLTPLWILVLFIILVLEVFLINGLCRLARLPSVPVTERYLEAENALRTDLTPWENEWGSWRFFVFLLMLAGVGGAVWNPDVPKLVGSLLALLVVGLGLLLATIGFYYFKRAGWHGDHLSSVDLSILWRQWIPRLLVLAVGVALLLPAGFYRLSLSWIDTGIKALGNGEDPFAFMSRRRDLGLPKQAETDEQAPQAKVGFFFEHFLEIFIVVLVLAVIVVWFLYQERGGNYRRLIRMFKGLLLYCLRLWRGFWKKINKNLTRFINKNVTILNSAEKRKQKSDNSSWGRGPRAVVRRGYYRLIREARERGFSWRPEQTPREIALQLAQMVPEETGEIDNITNVYRESRYGAAEPTPEKAREFERGRRRVQIKLDPGKAGKKE